MLNPYTLFDQNLNASCSVFMSHTIKCVLGQYNHVLEDVNSQMRG